MSVIVRKSDGRYQIYRKGASEIFTKKCTNHVVVSKDAGSTIRNDEGYQRGRYGQYLEDDHILHQPDAQHHHGVLLGLRIVVASGISLRDRGRGMNTVDLYKISAHCHLKLLTAI